jgi:hypothetical protein
MSIAALSGLPNQQWQTYFSTRKTDLTHLNGALQSGNLDNAKQAFQAILNLGQNGPFKNGAPFLNAQREADFAAIGQALQSGDLAAAQQAFQALRQTFSKAQVDPPPPVAAPIAPVQSSNVSIVA